MKKDQHMLMNPQEVITDYLLSRQGLYKSSIGMLVVVALATLRELYISGSCSILPSISSAKLRQYVSGPCAIFPSVSAMQSM